MQLDFQGMERKDHPGARRKLDSVDEPLYVVTSLFNPAGWHSRPKNYLDFEKHMLDCGVHLITVEAALGERQHILSETTHHNHTIIRVRVTGELWIKENLMNIGFYALPSNAKYVAFIDADMIMTKYGWVEDTLRQLQHHPVVQMFSEVGYLDPEGILINTRISFAERWMRGYKFICSYGTAQNDIFHHPRRKDNCTYDDVHKEWGPPGGGWAFRVKELSEVGGLMDFCILGSADWYMAACIAGFAHLAIPKAYGEDLRRLILHWEKKAVKVFRKNIGVVTGLMLHNWHGKMTSRMYGHREAILKDQKFSPLTDLIKNRYNVYELFDDGTERMRSLRDKIRQYQNGRNEDDVVK